MHIATSFQLLQLKLAHYSLKISYFLNEILHSQLRLNWIKSPMKEKSLKTENIKIVEISKSN